MVLRESGSSPPIIFSQLQTVGTYAPPAKAGIHPGCATRQSVIPAKAGIHQGCATRQSVIPAKAGIHQACATRQSVIPAKAGIHLIVSAREAKARVKGGPVDSRFRGNDIVSLLALQWARRSAGFLPLAAGGAWRIHCFACMRRQGRRHKQRCRRHPRPNDSMTR